MQFNTISIKKQDADKLIAAQKLFFNTQNQSRIGDLVAQELYIKKNKPLLDKLETISSALSGVKSTTQNVERQIQQQEKTQVIKQILSMLGNTEGLDIFEEEISSPTFDKDSSYIDDTFEAVIKLYENYKEAMKTTPTSSAPPSAKKGRKPVKKQTIQEIRKLADYDSVSENELKTLTAERLSSLLRNLEGSSTITPESFREMFLEERDVMKITRKLPEAPTSTPRTRELEKRVEELGGVEETKREETVSGDGIGQMMLDLASLQAGNNSPVVIKRAITALYNNKMIKKRVMNRLMKEYLK